MGPPRIERKLLTLFFLFLFSFSVFAQIKEKEVIAAVLILEAGGESDIRAMPAVFEVIKNRAKDKRKTWLEICIQKKQFSCLNNLSPETALQKAKSHVKWSIALDIVSKNKQTDYVKGAKYYYADYISPPGWSKEMRETVRIGRHIFLK